MEKLLEIRVPDFVNKSEKGFLAQLVHDGHKQVNVIVSPKGSLRGGHYHNISTESFYIISGDIRLELKKGELKEEYTFSEGDFFSIFPGVTHVLEYLSDCTMVGLYDVPVELTDGTIDIHKDDVI